METFALADNKWQSGLQRDLSLYEIYKMRLVRVDLKRCGGTRDLLRHGLRKGLRALWFFLYSRRSLQKQQERLDPLYEEDFSRSHQNTGPLADMIARFLVAILTAAFLIAPLGVLTKQTRSGAHLLTVSIFILAFSIFLAVFSRATNQEIMGASAAYAAVLVVFVSSRTVA